MVVVRPDKFSVDTGGMDNTNGRNDHKVAAVTVSPCGTLDNDYHLSSFDTCWFGMQLGGVENLKSTVVKKDRTIIKAGGRGSLHRTRSILSSAKPLSFLDSCSQSHFVCAGFQEDRRRSSPVNFIEKRQRETGFRQPNESGPCSDIRFWQGEVVDVRIKLVNDTLIEAKHSCDTRQRVPMLQKKRKASPRSTSVAGNLIKCPRPAQEVSGSVLKALMFSLGVGVGLKSMLDFSKTEVENLLQKLREAETKIKDLTRQLDSNSKSSMDGIVSCSSMSEDPDSHQLLGCASQGTDAKVFYNDATEYLHLTSGREGGGPFKGVLRVDSADSMGQIADLEAELEAELEILQMNLENECSSDKGLSGVSDLELDPLVEVVHGELSSCGLPGMHDVTENKDYSPDIAVRPANWAVCPSELERRLQILLQTRQEKHISELEAELSAAELKLKSKDKLIEAWKGRVRRLTMLLSSGDAGTKVEDQRRNNIAAQAERNRFFEDKHDTAPRSLKSSIHDHEIVHTPVKHLDQIIAVNFNKYIASSIGSTVEEGGTATSSMDTATNKDTDELSWESLLLALEVSTQEEGNVISQARHKSLTNVLSEQVVDRGMDGDAFESSRTKVPIENPLGVKASNSPEPFCHFKNASCAASDTAVESDSSQRVYEQHIKARNPTFMNIGRFDQCKMEDNQGCIWNNNHLSAPTNTPVGAAQARKHKLSNTPNSSVTPMPIGFHTSTGLNVNEKVKFWEEVSKGGSVLARNLELEASSFSEVAGESWNPQGQPLGSVSSTSSENDLSSDESSMLDPDEDTTEALIKRIVEKTKSGSSIVSDVQTMLAVFEKQESCYAREENATVKLDMEIICPHEHNRDRFPYEAGKREMPPSGVPTDAISLHATPKSKSPNGCKRSLFEEPLCIASKGSINT